MNVKNNGKSEVRSQKSEVRSQKSEVRSQKSEVRKPRILIVEDCKGISEAYQVFLETEGYLVDCVSNGQEALDYLERDDLPSLILLNLGMPVMNGLEFREKQRMNPKIADIHIIIMSSEDAYFESAIMWATQAQCYLGRPIDLDQLLAAVKRYCTV